ncbi:MAG: hypothetical protein H8E25_04710 [Planctomycetes bacterium]|nr:hypothetical protein [Planctomycetota bacterium]
MSSNKLVYALVCAMLSLPACGGGTTTKVSDTSATIGGGGPQVSNTAPPPPNPPVPNSNQTVYVAHVVDAATGYPIGGAKCSLLRRIPEPEYMRLPARRDVISDYVTPLHGQFVSTADADGEEKYILVAGRGFDPFITEAGKATAGQTHEMTIKATIIPTIKFVVRGNNGDRADNAICTMKPEDPAKIGNRGGSANIGTTERADDFGTVTFNRNYGKYRLIFTDAAGRYRYYGTIDWTAEEAKKKKHEIQLPKKSMQSPWKD